jgi:hypothetical protein
MKGVLYKHIVVKIALGIATFIGLGFAAYTSLHDRSFRQREFESIGWKEGSPRTRGEMVASLQAKSLLLQKSRDDVTALLGKPDEDYQVVLRYRVDVGRRIAWEPFLLTLIVKLDENARVYRVETVD